MITPDYYDKFICIGSKCKNNCCCGGWEIEVDDEALEGFQKIDGEFGERVRASVNEENVFIRKDGKCPLLSDDGLCEMVKNGEKLCVVCDEYPRYTEYFDGYEERGISLSCEAAADIILNSEAKTVLVGTSGECDEEIFKLLISARGDVFWILQNRSMDIYKRIRLMLDYGEELQNHINSNDFSEFHYIPSDRFKNQESKTAVFEFLQTLDYLDDARKAALSNTEAEYKDDPIKIEQIAVYFVYRYMLKAVFDCDVLSKLKFAAISVMAIEAMSVVCGNIFEGARQYSLEIEHNEENVDMIYDEFLFNPELSTDKLINMLK